MNVKKRGGRMTRLSPLTYLLQGWVNVPLRTQRSLRIHGEGIGREPSHGMQIRGDSNFPDVSNSNHSRAPKLVSKTPSKEESEASPCHGRELQCCLHALECESKVLQPPPMHPKCYMGRLQHSQRLIHSRLLQGNVVKQEEVGTEA